MDCTDVGPLTKVIIGHDNAGFGASWYLDCVEVTNYATNENWFFPCSQWLDKSKGDKKIERELLIGDKTQELKNEPEDEEEKKEEKKKTMIKKKRKKRRKKKKRKRKRKLKTPKVLLLLHVPLQIPVSLVEPLP